MAEIIVFPAKPRLRLVERPEARYTVLRAPSDSMAPTIAAGDVIELDEACNAIDRDGLFLLGIEGEPAIRRVQRLLGGRARISCDACPEAAEIVEREALAVLARVTRHWRENRN